MYVRLKTRTTMERIASVLFALMFAAALCACLEHGCSCESTAEAEEAPQAPLETSAAILKLQPSLTPVQNELYAAAINVSAARHGLDPLLLVAMIMRESSFNEHARGSAGEIGLMQIMPGVAARFAPDGCDVENDPTCNIATGARYLSFIRDHCQGSWSIWISAYGRRRCPVESTAVSDLAVRRALRYYTKIGGNQWH